MLHESLQICFSFTNGLSYSSNCAQSNAALFGVFFSRFTRLHLLCIAAQLRLELVEFGLLTVEAGIKVGWVRRIPYLTVRYGKHWPHPATAHLFVPALK
jgi:hypothetical protein